MPAKTDKTEKKTSLHAGHRERVRERYNSNGLDGFADHEILELLLFYTNKRGDTNPVAHRLIERFGSLSAVLEAGYDDLISVDGVGDSAATLITMVPQLFRRYSADKADKTKTVFTPDDAKAFLVPRFYGLRSERVGIVCLDTQGRINNFVFVSEGSLKLAQVDVRKIAQLALQNNADSIILAHNHPDGFASPSRNDVEATKLIVNALSHINVRVADHVIVSGEEAFSMASNNRFSPTFMTASAASASAASVSMSQDTQDWRQPLLHLSMCEGDFLCNEK